MSHEGWVQKVIVGVVIGNLIVLSIYFLAPRMKFFSVHRGLNSNHFMETTGSLDMPNQLSQTYKVVNRIRELTAEDAILFMPPGDRKKGSFRSAAIQILYPRKIFFGEDGNFERELKGAKKSNASYFVYSPEWKPEFCEEPSRIELTDIGFGMCRLEK